MLRNYDTIKAHEHIRNRARDPRFILQTANAVTAHIGRRMYATEMAGLVDHILHTDFSRLRDIPPDTIIDYLARRYANQIDPPETKKGDPPRHLTPDSAEIAKRHIGAIAHDGPESAFAPLDHPSYNPAAAVRGISLAEQFSPAPQGPSGPAPAAAPAQGPSGPVAPLDIHEMLKSLLSTEPTGGRAAATTALENKTRPFDPAIYKYPRINKQTTQNLYLLLDSKYRELSTDFNTFRWTVLHSPNTVQGTVNTLSDQIHNIISMQFNRFRIPYSPSADNTYQSVALFIEEFSATLVLINNGRRYHMMFDTEIVGNRIALNPLINDKGRFRFYTPINILDTITIKFLAPFNPITFAPDRYLVTITSINPTQSTLTFPIPHSVADGELIELEGFNTLAPAADSAQIAFVNREEGHIVTFIDNITLRIEAALATITPDPTNMTRCFIAARRIVVPLRMEYLVE